MEKIEHTILKKIKKNRAEGDVFIEKSSVVSLKYKANRCKEMNEKIVKGIGIRVIKKNKVGFSSTANIDNIENTIDDALMLSKFGEDVRFKLPHSSKKTDVITTDQRIKKLTPRKMRQIADEVRDGILDIAPDVNVDLSIKKVSESIELYNTRGLHVNFDIDSFTLHYSAMFVKGKNILFLGDFINFAGNKRWSVKPLINRFKKYNEWIGKTVKIKSGKYQVIVHPFSVPSFLLPLLSGMNGRNYEKKITPLLNAENKQIANEKLTLIDDPLIPNALWSSPVDGEGIERKTFPLIENGIFKSFIFDLRTASKVGRKSTGHAMRNYSTLPSPSFTNLVVIPGKRTIDSIIKDMDEGILILETIGAGQSNITAGDFSMELGLGFYIKNGEIKGRIKKTMVSGNIYQLLPYIEEIGKEPMEMPGGANFITPPVVFSGVSITAAS